MIMCVENRV